VKKAAHDVPGGDEVNDGVEMAGWGVEEAERKNKAEASMLYLPTDLLYHLNQQCGRFTDVE
jgi:hypothetical protein